MTIHTVKAGETLTSIGAVYGVSADIIAALNGLALSSPLAVGQALVIRFPNQVYTVKQGDTVSSIAAAYGVTVNALFRANPNLYGSGEIRVGQRLVIRFEGTPPYDIVAL